MTRQKTYKLMKTNNNSNLRIVMMPPGDQKVAGCFRFSGGLLDYRKAFKQDSINNFRMLPGDPTGSPDALFSLNFGELF
jgi:hypothetical protein